MRLTGPHVNLYEEQKTVEQALRELKIMLDDDIKEIKANRRFVSPAEKRREAKKVKRANVRRYNKGNNHNN